MARSAAILVPTIGSRPALLRLLIEVLQAQLGELNVTDVSIVVGVDGACSQPVDVGEATVVFTGQLGAAAVRNHLARTVDTEWLVFLDDDVLPHPGWAEALMRNMLQTHVCAGAIDPPALFARAGVGRLQQSLGVKWFGPTPRRLGRFEHLAAGHLAIRRDVFLRAGGFRRVPGGRNEDVDLHYRLHDWPGIWWAPDLRVNHLGRSRGSDFDWYAQGLSDAATDSVLSAGLRWQQGVKVLSRSVLRPGEIRRARGYLSALVAKALPTSIEPSGVE